LHRRWLNHGGLTLAALGACATPHCKRSFPGERTSCSRSGWREPTVVPQTQLHVNSRHTTENPPPTNPRRAALASSHPATFATSRKCVFRTHTWLLSRSGVWAIAVPDAVLSHGGLTPAALGACATPHCKRSFPGERASCTRSGWCKPAVVPETRLQVIYGTPCRTFYRSNPRRADGRQQPSGNLCH
jgi:hypothetical protein